MSRQDDLVQSIDESRRIIREYEAIIRTSDRPEEKARARRILREQRALVEGYQAELDALAGGAGDSQAAPPGQEAGGRHGAIYRALQAPPYARLPSAHIRRFEALIADKTEGFVGRQFVFDALDDFLRDNASGYYVILGEPGIGKTALLAQLVKTRGYAHHFNVVQENIRTPRQFLANACAQIVARYRLPHPVLPDAASEDPGFLVQCLGEAAARPENRPVVLVVDALDESERLGIGPGGNLLHLPVSLPEGAYLVVASRPLDDLQLEVSNSRELFLEPDSEGNLVDIRTYIAHYLRSSAELRTRLAGWRLDDEAFIRALALKSEGNFIYLRQVLPDIAEGRFREGTVDELPRGLAQYYRRHWRQMQVADQAAFDDLYAPVVCMLAVAREPVTVEQLHRWTRQEAGQIRRAMRQWREFLEQDDLDGERTYRVYHTSFRDFLAEQVDLRRFRMMIATYYRELAART
jgi:hypothetical protein